MKYIRNAMSKCVNNVTDTLRNTFLIEGKVIRGYKLLPKAKSSFSPI